MSSSSQQVSNPPHHGDSPAADSVDAIAAGCSADDGHALLLPKPTAAEVHACQFSSWYYTFRNMDTTSSTDIVGNSNNNYSDNIYNKKRNKLRKNITIESVIIRPLPSDFIQYLLSDGVRLPECATKVSSCMNDDNNIDDVNNSSEDENNFDATDDDDEPETTYSFPCLTQQVQSSINQLGNICMPKMNWSSPKDATWINCGSLKCSTPGDVYLLLKSSDFIVFDLEKAWEDLHVEESSEEIEVTKNVDNSGATGVSAAVNQLELLVTDESSHASVTLAPSHECTTNNKDNTTDIIEQQHQQLSREEFEHELILRKWCNLHPSMEFRCFIYEHELGEHILYIQFDPPP
jgi:hypothetical protein